MISYTQALELLEQNAVVLAHETIAALDSLERVSAENVYSQLALPSFDNSAMDGFALRFSETLNAAKTNQLRFLVSEIIPAGVTKAQSAPLAAEALCSEIMTGAALPRGYDAVVPVELVHQIEIDGKRYIQIEEPVAQFANLRFSGEDVRIGDLVLVQGQQISPAEVMLLCALGIHHITVFEKISLVIATSGEEVSDDYAKPLRHGEIYNSNAPLLLNMSAAACFAPRYYGILRDNRQTLLDFIANSTERILITTGAVSKGKWDFIPETLRELGAEIVFHSVAIRPGKPILFARLPDGRYFFGLPGNPVSAMVGWRFFVIPFLRKMLAKERERGIELKLAVPFKKKHSLRQFLKAELQINAGVAAVEISSEQESFKIKALSVNNLWAIALEEQHSLAAGELISAVPRYADFS